MFSVNSINQQDNQFGLLTKPQTETTGSVAANDTETTGQVANKKVEEPLLQFVSPETTGSVANAGFSMVA